jgi:flagellar hook protein FlgE
MSLLGLGMEALVAIVLGFAILKHQLRLGVVGVSGRECGRGIKTIAAGSRRWRRRAASGAEIHIVGPQGATNTNGPVSRGDRVGKSQEHLQEADAALNSISPTAVSGKAKSQIADLKKLLGYPASPNGVIQPGAASPLQLPTSGINPQVTSQIDMEFNLDSRLAVTAPTAGAAINFTDPTTYNNATSMSVYDDKGQDVALTYYFQKAATDTWNVFVTANGTTIAGTAAAPLPVTTIAFPPNGSAPTSPAAPIAINIPASTNAAGAVTLPIPGVQLDLTSSTQYGTGFGVTNMTQDGFAPGQLNSISIESNGIVMARYSNGQSRPAGQIEVATFRNPQGLQPLGGNAWGRTFTSGDPVLGTPGNGNLGVLQAGALEESNVDLTAELVNMITAQRIYQANAQTIKTVDQIMQTLVNMR